LTVRGLRRSTAAVGLAALALGLAACGDDSTGKTDVEASTPAEERLAQKVLDELEVYDVGFDLESMPQDQAEQLEPIVDNLPQAGGGVRVLRVEGSVVEAETDFAADENGEQTGHLICGAIVRAGGDDVGSQALGEDGAVLADCESEDAAFP
jgi:hypothetical protein